MTQTKIDEFTIIRTLGVGGFAKVKLAINNKGDCYALKIFKTNVPRTRKKIKMMFKEEAFFCSCQFDHQNLLRYFESRENATKYKKNGDKVEVSYIIQEYVKGKELFTYLQKTGGLSEKICRHYFIQML